MRHVGEDLKKLEPSYMANIVFVEFKSTMVQLLWKIPYDLSMLLLDTHSNEFKTCSHAQELYTNFHRSIIHNSQKVEMSR